MRQDVNQDAFVLLRDLFPSPQSQNRRRKTQRSLFAWAEALFDWADGSPHEPKRFPPFVVDLCYGGCHVGRIELSLLALVHLVMQHYQLDRRTAAGWVATAALDMRERRALSTTIAEIIHENEIARRLPDKEVLFEQLKSSPAPLMKSERLRMSLRTRDDVKQFLKGLGKGLSAGTERRKRGPKPAVIDPDQLIQANLTAERLWRDLLPFKGSRQQRRKKLVAIIGQDFRHRDLTIDDLTMMEPKEIARRVTSGRTGIPPRKIRPKNPSRNSHQ
jgi:hypothetical protein